MAEAATPGLKLELERRDAQRVRHEAKTVEEARAIAARLESANLRFGVNAGPTGALFGSVTATNVADRLWEQEKVRIDRRRLQMSSIKRIGRYSVPLEVFPDVVAELKVVVAPEGQDLPTDEELAELEAAEAAAAGPAEPAALAEAAVEQREPAAEAVPAEQTPEPAE
jgi:large subunit ribosomal protein L9